MLKRNIGPALLLLGVVGYLIATLVLSPFEYPALFLLAVGLVIVGAILTLRMLLKRRRRDHALR